MNYRVLPITDANVHKAAEAADLFSFARDEKWFRKYYDYCDEDLGPSPCRGHIIEGDDGRPYGIMGMSQVPIFVGREKLPAYHLFTLGAEKVTGNIVFELVCKTVKSAGRCLVVGNSTRGGVAHDIWIKFARFKEGPHGGEIRRYGVVNKPAEWLWQLKYRFRFIPNVFLNFCMRSVGYFGAAANSFVVSPDFDVCRVYDFTSEEYAVFWQKFLEGNTGVISSREPRWMQWRYGQALQDGSVCLFLVKDGRGAVLGYALITRRTSYGALIFHYVVLDVCALNNDVDVIRTALSHSCMYAAKHHGVRLEYIGANPKVDDWTRGILDKVVDLRRNTFVYQCADDRIGPMLDDKQSGWFWGPFDGERAYFWGN